MEQDAKAPKRFFKRMVSDTGLFVRLNALFKQHPNFYIHGAVKRDSSHYVHERSTSVTLDLDWDVDDGDETQAAKLVGLLETHLEAEIVAWNRQIAKELYADLEYYQADAQLIEHMEANEWLFDEDGKVVPALTALPIDNLDPAVRERVLVRFASMFGLTREQTYERLMTQKVSFDKRGQLIDKSGYRTIHELDAAIRDRVLDKNRSMLIEFDEFWSESTVEWWQTALEAYGFKGVKIGYSLGYAQGDGASFTADSIDVRQYSEHRAKGTTIDDIKKEV